VAVAYAPEAGARFNPMSPVGPRLEQGALVVRARSKPGTVTAGSLRVEVRAAARLQVLGEVAEVEVLEGEARVFAQSGATVLLRQGERLRSDDPRLKPAAPTPAPGSTPAPASRAPDACAPLPDPGAKRGCYTQAAMGEDLAAQNALYTLGLLERGAPGHLGSAVEYWQAYQRRFPQGALWPEASTNVLTAELELGRYPEALKEAEAYLGRDPDSDRAASVRLMRANLLREHLGRAKVALEEYRALRSSQAPAAVREEATFAQALAEAELGQAEAARATLGAYLAEFPGGAHAAEARRRMGP
jgi:TolA-binding protein